MDKPIVELAELIYENNLQNDPRIKLVIAELAKQMDKIMGVPHQPPKRGNGEPPKVIYSSDGRTDFSEEELFKMRSMSVDPNDKNMIVLKLPPEFLGSRAKREHKETM
jgi:hypothetical protein